MDFLLTFENRFGLFQSLSMDLLAFAASGGLVNILVPDSSHNILGVPYSQESVLSLFRMQSVRIGPR